MTHPSPPKQRDDAAAFAPLPPYTVTVEKLTAGHAPDSLLFQDFSITLPGAQWTCLLGASGVGKSSLLRFIAALSAPIAGTCRLHTGHSPPVALQCNHIGFLFQEDRLLPWLNCTENVALHSRLHASKGAHRQQKEKAAAMLEAVGLRDHMHKKPAALSGGMKQRVALARTLMTDAPIIFMDEPFSALDTTTRWSLQDLAMKIFQDKTVCLITHDPLEAVRLAHNIHIMHRPISAQSQPHMAVQTTAFSPPTTPPPRAAQDAATLAASAALITAQHAINNTPIAGGTASCHQL